MKNKMKSKRYALLLASALTVSTVLAGCGGGKSAGNVAAGGSGAGNTGGSGEQVTISHYTIDSEDRTFIEKLIPEF
ncbi:NMT1/THI5 like domain-containing protein, partial [Paenibacillus sp. FSL R7-277]